jgi:transcriptional regulator with XRE-family HTH domain
MDAQIESICKRIKEVRRVKGLIQKDFSSLLGIKRTTISGIERGAITPTLPHILTISEKLGVSLPWLLTGQGAMHSKDETGFDDFADYSNDVKQLIDDMRESKPLMHNILSHYYSNRSMYIDGNGDEEGEVNNDR